MTKMLKRIVLLVVVLLPLASAAFAGPVADEFIGLGRAYERAVITDFESGIGNEITLRLRESELLKKLLADEAELALVAARAAEIETGLRARLIDRVRFELAQEGRTSLSGVLEALVTAQKADPNDERGKKKIAMIYGRPVDMRDGEWHETPDGKRYWTSNEYPEIVLSPAEYRRYLATASEVEE
ncbi:MAG TPA: hypothetical protein PLP29_19660 [Candidatus Ozemobacteraceae bacterium]|nr:hypothetical protein [Candidatus Ozemobacteraceae bacterium]